MKMYGGSSDYCGIEPTEIHFDLNQHNLCFTSARLSISYSCKENSANVA